MPHPLTWDEIELAARRLGREAFVASVDAHGHPHLAVVWLIVFDGSLFFVSDRGAVKARNLSANPAISAHWQVGRGDGEGDQLLVRGTARFVEDPERREAMFHSGLWDDLSRWYSGPQAPELAFIEVMAHSASLTPDWGAGTARRWSAG